MEKRRLEEIFSRYPNLPVPERIFVLEAPLAVPQIQVLARGVTVRSPRGSIVVLTPQATEETVVHESIHNAFGFGEFITYPLARLLVLFRRLLPPLRRRKVEFRERTVSTDELRAYGIALVDPRTGEEIRGEVRVFERVG